MWWDIIAAYGLAFSMIIGGGIAAHRSINRELREWDRTRDTYREHRLV
jgi:hypothetical protein